MNYGIPYKGSKSKIAMDIIGVLPSGRRFVDLFGGGGAMSHAALLSGKYDCVYYNELNPLLVDLLKRAIRGDFNYKIFKPEFITHAEFDRLKDSDGYIKYIWSFGNQGKTYMFGADIEEKKHAFHDAVVFGKMEKAIEYLPEMAHLQGDTIEKRRLSYNKIIKYAQRCDLEQLERLERLEQLERLGRLQQLQRLDIHCGSFLDYSYSEGDVVYCDPPYEGTTGYSGGFNHAEFYEWVATRPYTVFFSSYDITDKRFFEVWSKEKLVTMSASDNRLKKVEKLFCNKNLKLTLF